MDNCVLVTVIFPDGDERTETCVLDDAIREIRDARVAFVALCRDGGTRYYKRARCAARDARLFGDLPGVSFKLWYK